MANTYRLNYTEFGWDDIDTTKYFSFHQTCTTAFLKNLEEVATKVRGDIVPFNAFDYHTGTKMKIIFNRLCIFTLHSMGLQRDIS